MRRPTGEYLAVDEAPKQLRVLLVEDSPTDAKLVLAALKMPGRSLSHVRVETADEMAAALDSGTWDAVVSDNSLPSFDAAGALRVIHERGLDLPFIIVSGTIDDESAVAAMRAGAHDYVLKDRLARLAPAVEREVREAAQRAQRRRVEDDSRQLAARFHAMIENSVEPVMLVAVDGTIMYASPASENVYGRPVDELVGAHVADFVSAEERDAVSAQFHGIVHEPTRALRASYCIHRPDGTTRWVESTVHDMLADPSVEAIVVNVRDMTERKLAADQLATSEARYRRIIETTNEGVWQVDAEFRTTFMNGRMASMLGYPLEQAMAMDVSQFVHAGELREGRQAVATAMQAPLGRRLAEAFGNHGFEREVRFVRRDGTTLWTNTYARPLFDADGHFEGGFAMVLDITARREADQARVAAEEALRKTDAQLRQAQKMEAVGRLAGGVAHDFNNLLSVILSYSTMLLEDFEEDHPARAEIYEICQAGRRAAELTRQLLAFSHQQVLEPQLIDINRLVSNMEKMCRRILGEDVELVSLLGTNIGKVRMDPGSLEQVLMNLVVNARDAMPSGGRIVIETNSVELDEGFAAEHLGVIAGPHVMLAVSDNGCGMDVDVRERIFEPFFTTKEKGKGTGLGLSTVFGIVQQSQGSVWVYSEPGKGTTFKVYLPEAQRGMTLRRSRTAVALASLQGNETVLLVEDEEQVRLVARGVLRRYGYNVLDAADVKDAIDIAMRHNGPIELLLTDVVMPIMSGPELGNRIREIRPDIKVLCMSGYTDDAVVRRGLIESGMAFMQKPIVPETLARKLREVLTG